MRGRHFDAEAVENEAKRVIEGVSGNRFEWWGGNNRRVDSSSLAVIPPNIVPRPDSKLDRPADGDIHY
jgi:hypothetical protein